MVDGASLAQVLFSLVARPPDEVQFCPIRNRSEFVRSANVRVVLEIEFCGVFVSCR